MHGELPQFKRCCFCIPLRRGLIGWGYIRLAIDIFNAFYLISIISWLYPRYLDLSDMAFMLVMVTIVFIDAAFTVLLIVAGHMKSAKLMRIVYIYGIVWLCAVVAFFTFITSVEIRRIIRMWMNEMVLRKYMILDLLLGVTIEFAAAFVQVYVTLLTRSEMVKLRNQTLEMQFVNHAADGAARCVRAEGPTESATTLPIDTLDVVEPIDDASDDDD